MSDPGTPSRLDNAARMLAERGVFGLVWLDERLDVVDRFGPLVEFVAPGHPAQDSLYMLIGFEDQLAELPASPLGAIDIPNVGVDLGGSSLLHVNVNVYWDAARRYYIVVVSRILAGADIEVELARQIRARSIAEAEIAAKSREIEAANEELRRINEDLDEFTSIISHDLKAPLRGLRYFTDDLAAALATEDRPQIEARIERLQVQIRRMSAMLTGLLDYSRAGRKEEAAEAVDTGRLAREIVASLAGTHGLTVEVEGDWPAIETSAAALDLVLRNLVDNAIKHHDRPDGHVRIIAEDAGPDVTVSVADDGPGIPVTWHEAIFRPFRRVERSAGVDGAGIGLAVVRKTVARMGGAIDVVSNPMAGRGTTFRVRWPKRFQPLAPRSTSAH